MRSIVIHGHFYQPPRDDPWTGTIPLEPNAAPFHDWNEGNGPGPRVVAGWLVEMPVNHDGPHQPPSAPSTWASTLGKRSSRRASSSAIRPAGSRAPPASALINRPASSHSRGKRRSA